MSSVPDEASVRRIASPNNKQVLHWFVMCSDPLEGGDHKSWPVERPDKNNQTDLGQGKKQYKMSKCNQIQTLSEQIHPPAALCAAGGWIWSRRVCI